VANRRAVVRHFRQTGIVELLTSSTRGFGGGGKVDLSSLRSFALRAPLEDLAFFPIVNDYLNRRGRNSGLRQLLLPPIFRIIFGC
jgi:hypothetical protein